MIQHIMLVASREFRQIAGTRSFWITLLLLPGIFVLAPLTKRFTDRSNTETVMLIDKSGGGVATAIRRQIEVGEQRQVLIKLASYVKRHDLRRAAPDAIWTRDARWFGDADVDAFVAAGGLKAARASIAKIAPEDARKFEAPEPDYRLVPTPPELAHAPVTTIDRQLEPLLRPADKSGRKPIDYIVLIPSDFGTSPVVRLWANGQPRSSFIAVLQGVLTGELRTRFLRSHGVAADTATIASAITPAISVTTPPEGSGRERVIIRSILPLASAYILMMSLLLSGSWMLQGAIEERSNKLIETVLACVTPNELMYGKLVGTVGIGLTMVLTWVACGLFAAFATQGEIAELIRPALEPVSSVESIATIIFFFVAGYLMVSMIFLVIGVMSESMRDAQGYLTPVIMVIMIPFTLLLQSILAGKGGLLLDVMTWIPLYTPFAVLGRLGSGIPAWQVIGSGAVLVAFLVVEVVLLGRVFRANLLAAGARPSLKVIMGMMRQRT